jgi:hypothetical protein
MMLKNKQLKLHQQENKSWIEEEVAQSLSKVLSSNAANKQINKRTSPYKQINRSYNSLNIRDHHQVNFQG